MNILDCVTLDDVLRTSLTEADTAAVEAARARQNSLTKPPGSLGVLEDLSGFMAGWQRTPQPRIENAQALVFAGNHGVCAQGVNPFPQEVTAQMVANFTHGGAAINQLCDANGARLSVIALDLDTPTGDISETVAMTPDTCLAMLKRGAEAVDETADILILGEMGIGNSTIAAALALAAFGGTAEEWVGPGTGADAAGVQHKANVIARAVQRHQVAKGLDILAALGGHEQAAICGAVLRARERAIPVVLDGFICTASVAPLRAAMPQALDHCLVGHASAEPGHRKLLAAMGKTAVLDMNMRLGEGSGAALALGIIRSALACHNGMATFDEAGVAGG